MQDVNQGLPDDLLQYMEEDHLEHLDNIADPDALFGLLAHEAEVESDEAVPPDCTEGGSQESTASAKPSTTIRHRENGDCAQATSQLKRQRTLTGLLGLSPAAAPPPQLASPSAPPHQLGSPSAPPHQLASPSAPPHQLASPSAPPHQLASSSAPPPPPQLASSSAPPQLASPSAPPPPQLASSSSTPPQLASPSAPPPHQLAAPSAPPPQLASPSVPPPPQLASSSAPPHQLGSPSSPPHQLAAPSAPPHQLAAPSAPPPHLASSSAPPPQLASSSAPPPPQLASSSAPDPPQLASSSAPPPPQLASLSAPPPQLASPSAPPHQLAAPSAPPHQLAAASAPPPPHLASPSAPPPQLASSSAPPPPQLASPFAPPPEVECPAASASPHKPEATIPIPPYVRLSHTTTAPAFLLVPLSLGLGYNIPTLPPAAQVQTSPAPSEPASPPVTSLQAYESVKDYILETKAYMSRASDDLGDGLTLSSNYVDSRVIQRHTIQSRDNVNKSLDKELSVMGHMDREERTVSLNQIFEKHHGSHSKSFHLLLGRAGMGKTTCIKKLCHDWSKNRFPQFDFVFLLDGRLLTVTEPKYSLKTLLLQLSSFTAFCSDSAAVFAQILATPRRTLVIFDGFEDLREIEILIQPLEQNVTTCLQKYSNATTFTIRQLYSAILQRLVLPGCSLLLSSRPRGNASLLLRKVDNLLEMHGFSPSDIGMYIRQYFPDADIQNLTLQCFRNCSYLTFICWNPGICHLVCMGLEQHVIKDDPPKTLTAICYMVLHQKLNGLSDERILSSMESVEEVTVSNVTATQSNAKTCVRQKASQRTDESSRGETDGFLSEMRSLAWNTIKDNSTIITSDFPISCKTRAVGLKAGLLKATGVGRRCVSGAEKEKRDADDEKQMIGDVAKEMECVGICEHEVLSWANPFLQSYLAAVHLSLTLQSSIFKKTLSFRCETSTKGRRRPLREEFELTQRFAVGLLFQNRADLLWLHPVDNLNNILLIKQTSLFTHIRNHKFRLLKPSQILNLCHFIYEGSLTTFGQSADTTTSRLARQVFDSLPENLTFNGVPLTPADVHAIKNIVEYGEEQRFSLDLTNSGIQVSGLRSLVGLNTVKTYRACIVDVISLWEELEKQKEDGFTCDAVTKFKIDPFKATQVCHVEHLAKLVDIHTNKRLPECQMSSIFAEGVAAVRDLHKLELELGPEKAPLALAALWTLLPGLHNLRHLDLENNNIGNDGALRLATALVSLSSIETLNLSQNTIGDSGVKSLSAMLINLPRLDRLSLHSNIICDGGAKSLAAVLPQTSALTELDVRYNRLSEAGAQSLANSLKQCVRMKSLRMWCKHIPYGVFARLQQQDHRIMDTF